MLDKNEIKEIEEKAKKIIRKFASENPCGEGRITLLTRRYVMLSTDYFPFDLTKDLEDIFGAAGDTLLFKGGKSVGMDLYKHYHDLADKYGVNTWNLISAVGYYFGWGLGRIVERNDEGAYRIRVYDSFEADSFIQRNGGAKKPVCHFIRGVLSGLVESVEGREYTVKEVKCAAMGDEYCEFLFEPK